MTRGMERPAAVTPAPVLSGMVRPVVAAPAPPAARRPHRPPPIPPTAHRRATRTACRISHTRGKT